MNSCSPGHFDVSVLELRWSLMFGGWSFSLLCLEAIADVPDGLDEHGVVRVRLNLAAQRRDATIHATVGHDHFIAPNHSPETMGELSAVNEGSRTGDAIMFSFYFGSRQIKTSARLL